MHAGMYLPRYQFQTCLSSKKQKTNILSSEKEKCLYFYPENSLLKKFFLIVFSSFFFLQLATLVYRSHYIYLLHTGVWEYEGFPSPEVGQKPILGAKKKNVDWKLFENLIGPIKRIAFFDQAHQSDSKSVRKICTFFGYWPKLSFIKSSKQKTRYTISYSNFGRIRQRVQRPAKKYNKGKCKSSSADRNKWICCTPNHE